MISREQEPAADQGDSNAAVRLAFGGFRTVNLPLDRAVLSPSSPLLASDRGQLTGPHPIIKIGQEPECGPSCNHHGPGAPGRLQSLWSRRRDDCGPERR
jgi:hypothetical protein